MKLRQSMRDTLRFFTCGAERWLAVFFLIYPLYAEQVACAGRWRWGQALHCAPTCRAARHSALPRRLCCAAQ